MDTKENHKDFSNIQSADYSVKIIMIFLRTEGPLHCSSSYPGQLPSGLFLLILIFARSTFLCKKSLDILIFTKGTIYIAGISLATTKLFNIYPKQFFRQTNTVSQSRSLTEYIER